MISGSADGRITQTFGRDRHGTPLVTQHQQF
jgi:hypothetical protein